MDKRQSIKKDLEVTVVSDVTSVGIGAGSSHDEEVENLNYLEKEVKILHQIESDLLDEDRKRLENKKLRLEIEQAKSKEEREAADREIKAIEKVKTEKRERRSAFWGRVLDTTVKVAGVVIPALTSVFMFKGIMRAEYRDKDIIPPKMAKDVFNKSMKF